MVDLLLDLLDCLALHRRQQSPFIDSDALVIDDQVDWDMLRLTLGVRCRHELLHFGFR